MSDPQDHKGDSTRVNITNIQVRLNLPRERENFETFGKVSVSEKSLDTEPAQLL